MKRINFGSGPVYADGWINIENDQSFYLDETTLDHIESESIDYIVAHHSLQCVDVKDFENVVFNIWRVLKPGGFVRVSIPDIIKGFRAYEDRDIDWFPQMNSEPIDERFCHWLTWYGQNVNPLTQYSLSHAFRHAGFKAEWARWANGVTHCPDKEITDLDTRYNESLYMEFQK